MKLLVNFYSVLFFSFCVQAGEVSLKEIKAPTSSKKYLEFSLPASEKNGVYKIWNLTQNKQVGSDIKKDESDISDLVLLSGGNPGDKYAILNSAGEVVGSYQNQSSPIIKELTKTQKANKQSSGTSSLQDQVNYIKSLRKSSKEVVDRIRYKLKEANDKLKLLLEKNSDKQIAQTCQTASGASDNKTMSISANCQESIVLAKAEAQATSNFEKATKYENQVVNDLKSAPSLPITPLIPSTPSTSSTPAATLYCPKVRAGDYVQFRMHSAWMNPMFGLDDYVDTTDNKGSYAPNSILTSKKELIISSEAYKNDKDIFLDRCRPQLPETWSNFSNARSSYKKVFGTRTLSMMCDNGVVKPERFNVVSTFQYDGDYLVSCPKYEEEACWPPSYKFEKYYKGEVFTKDMYTMKDRADGLPVTMTGVPGDDIPATGVYAYIYCKVDEKIYSVMRSPLYECVPNEKVKYIGMGTDAISDSSAHITSLLHFPGGAGTYEKALEQYKSCDSYGIDINKAFNTDKEKRLDGLYSASGSTEEFMVEEEIGTGKISIDSTFRGAHYKGLVRKNSEGQYLGKAVDYPGACLEIVPTDLSIERVSSNEIKLNHIVLEDSCTFKKGGTYTFSLKRK